MLELLKAKIESYATQIETAVSSTNFLTQVKTELENIYSDFVAASPDVEAAVAIVDPAVAPAVDAAVSATEAIASAV